MATKSILKEIRIKDKRSARSLVYAIENAGKASAVEVKMSRPVSTATREEIQKMFGAGDDRIQGR